MHVFIKRNISHATIFTTVSVNSASRSKNIPLYLLSLYVHRTSLTICICIENGCAWPKGVKGEMNIERMEKKKK